ncbi:MAG: sulfite exporter TauE/SafE family protein, partial [Phycisphaerales bacterium]|nr:sulfite exporter TauE/SafE family protein [Phycisphaerales bacterium]
MTPFLAFLALFYVTWLLIVIIGNHWGHLADHWPIAAAMAVGSYFAGSTPMGGGTIGFPILVLVFDQPAEIGRNFSFAIQSIGMVSASIFILASRRPLEWPMLRWAMIGSLIGTPLGSAFIAPLVSDLFVKLLFAVLWASFGILHFVKIGEIAAAEGITPNSHRFDRRVGLTIGLLGGATVACITGVGVDMLIYAALVLLSRADLKIAIPTSVILMAWTSVIGIATNVGLSLMAPERYGISREVYLNWLAAAPVVALGAPFGALIVARIGRKPTLVVVSALCVVQFVWTCIHEWSRMGVGIFALAIVGLLIFNAGFHLMWIAGRRLAARRGHVDLDHVGEAHAVSSAQSAVEG